MPFNYGSRPASFSLPIAALFLVLAAAPAAAAPPAAEAPERVDYLTFAQGAVPLSVTGPGAGLGAGFEQAIRATDGNPGKFSLNQRPGAADTFVEFLYELPAPTTFDRFAVPEVNETPSPNQTFTAEVEVHGSAQGPDALFALLAAGKLSSTQAGRGQVTELRVERKAPVRWVKLRLKGGVLVQTPESFFEFSEIIGNGVQDSPPLSDRFRGHFKGKGVSLQIQQEGPVVKGCYDRGGVLEGTVTGNILRATGVEGIAKTRSAFLLTVAENGELRGLRSSNGAPFALYFGNPAPKGTEPPACASPATPSLGCGSILHGIRFDFDSAAIRPESEPVLAALHKGLAADKSAAIAIEGHTSSEGTNEYNQKLSEQRARAVVADLVKRGIEAKRLSAAGFGETKPIARNDDESGRAMNRRVEIHCR